LYIPTSEAKRLQSQLSTSQPFNLSTLINPFFKIFPASATHKPGSQKPVARQ